MPDENTHSEYRYGGTIMNYRQFGNTGEKISALGFGCMRFPEYEKDGKKYVVE